MDKTILAKEYLTHRWAESIVRKTNGTSQFPIRFQQNYLLVKLTCKLAQIIAGPRAWIGELPTFILGSADFMKGGSGCWHLLELNGGSSRGMQSLHMQQWRLLVNNVYLRVKHVTEKVGKLLVGHYDGAKANLLVDRMSIAEIFKLNGWEVNVLPYSRITSAIALEHDFILGDGVTRRLGWNHNLLRLPILVANTIANITDSKLGTYIILRNLNLKGTNTLPLPFRSASNFNTLVLETEKLLHQVEAVVPKFNRGSGGAGVFPIFRNQDVEGQLKNALKHYQKMIGSEIDPWPAAIMKLIYPPHLGRFGKLGRRVFDVRFYYSVNKRGFIECHGAKMRVARRPFTTGGREAYVTNLTGYKGVEFQRGLGINWNNLKAARINIWDLAQAAAAGIIVFSALSRKITT